MTPHTFAGKYHLIIETKDKTIYFVDKDAKKIIVKDPYKKEKNYFNIYSFFEWFKKRIRRKEGYKK